MLMSTTINASKTMNGMGAISAYTSATSSFHRLALQFDHIEELAKDAPEVAYRHRNLATLIARAESGAGLA